MRKGGLSFTTFVPEDWQTNEPLPKQIVVALEPYTAAAGQVEVQLDEPNTLENVVVKLAPQPLAAAVDCIMSDLGPQDRGVVETQEKQELEQGSLVGKAAT